MCLLLKNICGTVFLPVFSSISWRAPLNLSRFMSRKGRPNSSSFPLVRIQNGQPTIEKIVISPFNSFILAKIFKSTIKELLILHVEQSNWNTLMWYICIKYTHLSSRNTWIRNQAASSYDPRKPILLQIDLVYWWPLNTLNKTLLEMQK